MSIRARGERAGRAGDAVVPDQPDERAVLERTHQRRGGRAVDDGDSGARVEALGDDYCHRRSRPLLVLDSIATTEMGAAAMMLLPAPERGPISRSIPALRNGQD